MAALASSGLALVVLLYCPTTTRRVAVPEVAHLLGDASARWLLVGVALLGLAMSILRPLFPIHCNIKAKRGDELAVGLSFSIFFSALHASGPAADWLGQGRERVMVVVVGLALTGGSFPFLLAHSHHLAETLGMALVGLSVGIAVTPAIPWLTEASERQGGRAKLREARLAFDRCFGLGTVLGPLLGGSTVAAHGGITEPIVLITLALLLYAGYGAKLFHEGRLREGDDGVARTGGTGGRGPSAPGGLGYGGMAVGAGEATTLIAAKAAADLGENYAPYVKRGFEEAYSEEQDDGDDGVHL